VNQYARESFRSEILKIFRKRLAFLQNLIFRDVRKNLLTTCGSFPDIRENAEWPRLILLTLYAKMSFKTIAISA